MDRPAIGYLIIFLALINLACAVGDNLSLPGVAGEPEAALPATRTPLPTFTATAPADQAVAISIPPTPTETAVPPTPTETAVPPTATEPPPQPTNTPEPEPTATNTPEPPPPPTQAPPPPPATEAPPPAPVEPGLGANGVIGKLEFRDGRNTYGVGEQVFVRIEASLPGGAGQKPFGVLGLTTDTGAFQSSWTNDMINGTFQHEDGVAFSSPGNHKIWLSICFDTIDICQSAGGNWERFEPGLDVIIQ
jgi:hypothetical protein